MILAALIHGVIPTTLQSSSHLGAGQMGTLGLGSREQRTRADSESLQACILTRLLPPDEERAVLLPQEDGLFATSRLLNPTISIFSHIDDRYLLLVSLTPRQHALLDAQNKRCCLAVVRCGQFRGIVAEHGRRHIDAMLYSNQTVQTLVFSRCEKRGWLCQYGCLKISALHLIRS